MLGCQKTTTWGDSHASDPSLGVNRMLLRCWSRNRPAHAPEGIHRLPNLHEDHGCRGHQPVHPSVSEQLPNPYFVGVRSL